MININRCVDVFCNCFELHQVVDVTCSSHKNVCCE